MKRFFFFLILTFTGVWVSAQTLNYYKWVVSDVAGNKDSVEFGYHPNRTLGLDSGEVNYYGLPYSDLDIRSVIYDSVCGLSPGFPVTNSLELKRDFRAGFNGKRVSAYNPVENVIILRIRVRFFPIVVTVKRNYLTPLAQSLGYSLDHEVSFVTFNDCITVGGPRTLHRVYDNTSFIQIQSLGLTSTMYGLTMDIAGLLDTEIPSGLVKVAAQPQPNPTANRFTIPGVGREGVLSLVNASGRVVRQESFVPGSEVDISSLPKGLYLFRLVSAGSVTQGKVVRE